MGSIPIILKLSFDNQALKKEYHALASLAKYGAVKILAKTANALILQRAIPGNSLKSYFPKRDQEATIITCNVIKRLHSNKTTTNFPHLKEWLKLLDRDWPIKGEYLARARILKEQLLSSTQTELLLHGDLHYDNILQDGDDWIVIDPKGVIGDPVYEVTAFIRNPMPTLLADDTTHIINHRIEVLSRELNFSKERIIEWSLVQAVLGAIWAIEDQLNPEYFLKLSQIFFNLSTSQ